MLLALVLLGSVPTLSVARGSDCAKELRSAGLELVESGAVELWLRAGPKNQLTLRRGTQVVLSRDLGPGSCDEAGRAAAVIVERWATSLAPPVVGMDAGVAHAPVPSAILPVEGDARVAADAGRAAPPSVRAAPDAGTPASTIRPSSARAPEAGPSTPPLRPVTEETSTPAIPFVTAVAAPDGVPPPGILGPDARTVTSTLLPVTEAAAPDGGTSPASVARSVSDETPAPVTPLPRGGEGAVVTHFEGLLGGGVVFLSVPNPVAPVVSADAALVLNRRVRVALTGLFDFGGTSPLFDEAGLTRGFFASRGGAVLPNAAWCFDFPLRFCAGLLAGARIVEGQASGTYVYDRKSIIGGALVLGPTVQLAWIPGAFHLSLDLSLLVTPVPPGFLITGIGTSTPVPLAQGLVRLSAGFGSDR